jgi:nitrite reductase/ring-hydroxylating ferredoxin subunit
VGRFLTRLIDAQAAWARPLGDFNQRWLGAILRPLGPLKDLLHGRWLGHPLHAAITDIPVGALTVTVVLDIAGQPAGADIALIVGIATMLLSALSGAADYVDTDGVARMRATVHSTLMVVALVLFVVSLVIRAGAPVDRTVPVALGIVGYLLVLAGAFVGGDVVYVVGNMVSRHAFRRAGTKWLPLDVPADTELPELVPTKAKLGANSVVLVRVGERIHAMHETCAHAGGPLSEGRIVDDCLECPWHGSRFRIADGTAARGPTVYDQPAYEIRRGPTGWEARRAGQA